jgi:hypothetical protein
MKYTAIILIESLIFIFESISFIHSFIHVLAILATVTLHKDWVPLSSTSAQDPVQRKMLSSLLSN